MPTLIAVHIFLNVVKLQTVYTARQNDFGMHSTEHLVPERCGFHPAIQFSVPLFTSIGYDAYEHFSDQLIKKDTD